MITEEQNKQLALLAAAAQARVQTEEELDSWRKKKDIRDTKKQALSLLTVINSNSYFDKDFTEFEEKIIAICKEVL